MKVICETANTHSRNKGTQNHPSWYFSVIHNAKTMLSLDDAIANIVSTLLKSIRSFGWSDFVDPHKFLIKKNNKKNCMKRMERVSSIYFHQYLSPVPFFDSKLFSWNWSVEKFTIVFVCPLILRAQCSLIWTRNLI